MAGESRAGAPAAGAVGEGEAFRISTGAAVPAGAGAVVRVEDTEERDGTVTLHAEAPPGENIREAGEDLRAGGAVLAAGTVVGPAELGVLVVAGRGEVQVAARPRIALVTTGDELVAPGEPLAPGQIHNSNLVALAALAGRVGAAPARHVPDRRDAEATEAALAAALEDAEVVAVSGGVSVGAHDHVKAALGRLGVEEVFWRVALQPGKPTWFGTRGEKLVFGLPGNPVSAMVTFALFVRPALLALQGAAPEEPGTARLAVPVRRNRQREQAVRVRLEHRDDGTWATPTGPQGSHLMTSMLGADALALVPAGEGELGAGETVALAALGA